MEQSTTILQLFVKKSVIEDYLRFIFGIKKGPIKIHLHNDVGKLIYSMVQYSEYPKKVKINPDEDIVEIVLPNHRLATAELNYCSWSRERMDRINEFILVDFNITFRGYMLAGREMGVQQKDLIEQFMAYTGMSDVGKKFDALKKKDYRHRLKIADLLMNSLEKIGYETGIKKFSELSIEEDNAF